MRVNVRKENLRSSISRDSSKGQITSQNPDKLLFTNWVQARNVNISESDWQVRNGIRELCDVLIGGAPADYYALDIFKKEAGNQLVIAIQDNTNAGKTEIQKIDRTTGAKTSLYANIAGIAKGCFASQNNFLHYVNNEISVKIYSALGTSTVSLPIADTKAKLCVSDGSRIWVSTDEGVTRFSDSQEISIITTFAPSGTALDRAGIATSDIVEVTCLKSISGYVLIAGKNQSEIHACPNFRNDQMTTFPDDFPTLKYPFAAIGCDNNDGAVATPHGFFIKPTYDEYLHLLPVGGAAKPYRDNSGRMGQLSFDGCRLTYDSRFNYIYIHAKEKFTQAPAIVVFDVARQAFFEYGDLFPVLWCGDSDDVYFMDRSNKIQSAFAKDVFNDNGVDINFTVRSADDFAGSQLFYKLASRQYIDAEYWGRCSFSYNLWDMIRPSGTGGELLYTTSYLLVNNASPLSSVPNYFSTGVPDNTSFDFESDPHQHLYDIDTLINRLFFRASVVISGRTGSRFRVCGVGFLYEPTDKHSRQITT